MPTSLVTHLGPLEIDEDGIKIPFNYAEKQEDTTWPIEDLFLKIQCHSWSLNICNLFHITHCRDAVHHVSTLFSLHHVSTISPKKCFLPAVQMVIKQIPPSYPCPLARADGMRNLFKNLSSDITFRFMNTKVIFFSE